jgi:adenosylmethionine-8-amino-7-oxononanoate aminotransferase
MTPLPEPISCPAGPKPWNRRSNLCASTGGKPAKPDKYKVISRWSSFHGNTTGALALGGHTARRSHYLPIFQHTPHIEPAYCYRCSFKETPETCDLQCADELERCIKHEGPESVGAFIAEPVVGATAGAVVPKDGYWQRIRQICDKYDVKLIATK